MLPPGTPRAEDVAFAAAGWALAVEYVDDLKRPPVARGYRPHAICLARSSMPAAPWRPTSASGTRVLPRTADETEALLADEVEVAQAEDLGKIDTFRFEEDKVLGGAIEALGRGDWAVRLGLGVGPRRRRTSFWLRDDPSRQSAWHLVRDAARLGMAIDAARRRRSTREATWHRAVERYA